MSCVSSYKIKNYGQTPLQLSLLPLQIDMHVSVKREGKQTKGQYCMHVLFARMQAFLSKIKYSKITNNTDNFVKNL